MRCNQVYAMSRIRENQSMNIATSSSASAAFQRKPSQRAAIRGGLVGVATAMAAAALLVATSANTQTVDPAGTEPASAAALRQRCL